MYAQLRLELDASDIDYKKSSNLQGVLMEQIDTEYAGLLHDNQLHPYSQCVLREDGKSVWYIRTLTDEAYEKIIQPMLELKHIVLKKDGREICITDSRLRQQEGKALLEEFYESPCPMYMDMRFLTPTAFKREGRYVFYPDLSLVYGSLMRKYSAASDEMEMVDEKLLEQLVDHSEIIRYRLQTIPFQLERTRITGFTGSIRMRLHGPQTLARYVRMLLRFGEYSGIGIKCGMGMGAMQYSWREQV